MTTNVSTVPLNQALGRAPAASSNDEATLTGLAPDQVLSKFSIASQNSAESGVGVGWMDPVRTNQAIVALGKQAELPAPTLPAAPSQSLDQMTTALRNMAVPLTLYDPNVGTPGYDCAAALEASQASGLPVSIGGLSLSISRTVQLRTGIVGNQYQECEISALPGFIATPGTDGIGMMIDLYSDVDLTPGRLVEGVNFRVSSEISVVGTSSPSGDGGRGRIIWSRCNFNSNAQTAPMLKAGKTSPGVTPGAFTGNVFFACSWRGPIPIDFGANIDDVLFLSPRFQLINASAVSVTPIVLDGCSNVVMHVPYFALDTGYTAAAFMQIGVNNTAIYMPFFEGTHQFLNICRMGGGKGRFRVVDTRFNTFYSGVATDHAYIRLNETSTDGGSKRVHIDGVTRIGNAGDGPNYLVSAFINGTPAYPADVYVNVSEEWSNRLMVGAASSSHNQGYNTRFHGWVAGERIEQSYQVSNVAGVISTTTRGLEDIPVDTTLTVTVNRTLPMVASGTITVTNGTGGNISVGLFAPTGLDPKARVGVVRRILNSGSSTGTLTVQSSFDSGIVISFASGGSNVVLPAGSGLTVQYNGAQWIELAA